MKTELTSRGFALSKFIDTYGKTCSIQRSSIIDSEEGGHIWLGIHDAEVQKCVKGEGWISLPLGEGEVIFSRMHLSQSKVKELLPLLQHFAEFGELP